MIGYYEYANNNIDKSKISLGFDVKHFNSLLGRGSISDVYSLNGQILLKIKFT